MNNNIKILIVSTIVIAIPFILIAFWLSKDGTEDTSSWKIRNLRIWKDTPVWDLALAVKNQNTSKIEKIAISNPELLNYQEPRFGATLLIWSVGVEKYNSTEALLKYGANPNITTLKGETAIFVASGYSWVDYQAKKDSKYVKLLLKYNADPNINFIGKDMNGGNNDDAGKSPLMNSIGCGIEKTKSLIDAGADLNHKSILKRTAAINALYIGGPNATIEGMEYARYLIDEKKANIKDPYYNRIGKGGAPDIILHPVDRLRKWTYPLGTTKHKIKMEIVKEFERQGVDYFKTEIPEEIINNIKEKYPDTWKEYIKKY